MRAFPHQVAAVALMLTSACDQPGIKSSESLVGAQELPSADVLSRELIQINRGYGDVSEGFLTYELKPDNTLVVTHENRHENKVVGAETFRLSPAIAAQARRMLWRLRPPNLEGQGLTREEVRPVGCRRRGPHDFGQFAVVFIDERQKRRDEDHRLAMFELPYLGSCNTPKASEARDVVKRVLESFPPSRVATEFPKSS